MYKPQRSGAVSFAQLLDAVASVDPEMRIRFTSPHPKEFSDEVLKVHPSLMMCSCQATTAATANTPACIDIWYRHSASEHL